MIQLKINGKTRLFPQGPEEITVRQFIMFTKAMESLEVTDDLYKNTVALAGCLAKFWDIPLDELGDLEVSDSGDEYDETLNQVDQFQSVGGLVQSLSNIIKSYTPQVYTNEMTFTYRGHIWTVPHAMVSKFTEQYLRPVLKFKDVVRLVEAQRIAEGFIGKKDKAGNDKDPEGSYQFTELKFVVASLATNPALDQDMTFDEKIIYFDEIDMKTAVDLAFFLTGSFLELLPIQDISTFSTPPSW